MRRGRSQGKGRFPCNLKRGGWFSGCAVERCIVYNGDVRKHASKGPGLNECDTKLLELLDRSGARLFALLTRLTLREDVAEELMQELFLKLSSAPNQASIDCWKAYARQVAINLAFDWRRRNRRRRTVLLEDIGEPLAQAGGPLGDAMQAEEFEQVLAAVGRLRGISREVFVMRHIQQDSYEEIAEQLGKTPHQVRALCFRAMKDVREILGCDPGSRGEKGVSRVETE